MQTELPEAARPALAALLKRAGETLTDELALGWRAKTLEWRLGKDTGPIQSMSVTKSIVGLLIGRLVTLNKLDSIDEPVHSFFPEWRQGRKRGITVRMLMEHTSGLQNVPMATEEIYPSDDFVQLALSAELASEPGEQFSYNNKAVNLLAGIVERADGRKLDDFAREELVGPLGTSDALWMHDASGNPHAMSGLGLHASDLVSIGRLVLQRGAWQGGQLIDPAWFKAMDAPSEHNPESALMWWHVPETRIEVADRHVEDLTTANAEPEVISVFEQLRGVHGSAVAFFTKVRSALGLDWHSQLPASVQAFDMETGPNIGLRAEGDLGQYVYIFPAAELVAVRLIREDTVMREVPEIMEAPDSFQEHMSRIEPFFFPDFEKHVLELAKALAPTRPSG